MMKANVSKDTRFLTWRSMPRWRSRPHVPPWQASRRKSRIKGRTEPSRCPGWRRSSHARGWTEHAWTHGSGTYRMTSGPLRRRKVVPRVAHWSPTIASVGGLGGRGRLHWRSRRADAEHLTGRWSAGWPNRGCGHGLGKSSWPRQPSWFPYAFNLRRWLSTAKKTFGFLHINRKKETLTLQRVWKRPRRHQSRLPWPRIHYAPKIDWYCVPPSVRSWLNWPTGPTCD